jgi:toxin ParE1/3/4
VTYRLLIRRQTKSDLRQAARWYEGQSPGLGREFVAEVEATLSRVVENPLQHQTIYRDVRRAIPHKFPYGVFYRIEQNNIVVFAIVHLHRDPSAWQDRQ